MNSNNSHELHRDRLIFLLKTLEDMGKTLTGGESFDTAARYLLRMLLGSIGISNGAIFTFVSSRKVLKLKDKTQGPECQFNELNITDDLIEKMAAHPTPQKIESLPDWLASGLDSMMPFWESNQVEVMIPLAVKGDLLGMVCLGRRFMNHSYTEMDLEILGLLTQHISLYFHSQKSLEQARKANFELRRKILEMEQLYEVGLAITSLKSPEVLLEEVLSRATTILDARYGAVWLLREGAFYLAGVFGFNRASSLPDIMTDLSGVAGTQVRFEPDSPVCLMAPMIIRNTTIGVLSVAGKESRLGGYMDFPEVDFQLLASFANQAAVAMENARLYVEAVEKERMDQELKVAAEIQEAILPEFFPKHKELDLSAMTLPCRTVGGDFFDFFTMADGRPAMVIADVSGKGVPAAMMVSTFHGALHALSGFVADLDEIASRINSLLVTTTPGNKFVTAAFLIWDPQKREFISLSAGHEPMILIRSDGTMTHLSEGGMILGLFSEVTYRSQTIRIEPGDCLCLYTDGMTDRINADGERFGLERLESLLQELVVAGTGPTASAANIVQNVFRRLEMFAGEVPPPDDQTMMMLIRKGA